MSDKIHPDKDNSVRDNISADSVNSLFEQIKRSQSLPDEVIIDFLDCRGKLFSTDFRERYFKNARQN